MKEKIIMSTYIAFIFSTLTLNAHNGRAYECPGHPTPNEIHEQNKEKERENDTRREILDDDNKKEYDKHEDAVIGKH